MTLDAISSKLLSLKKKWGLARLKAVPSYSSNQVFFTHAYTDKYGPKLPVVLKIGSDSDAMANEMCALNVFGLKNCVQVIDHDLENGALLLERITPGATLKHFFPKNEQESLEIVVELIKNLQKTSVSFTHAFPTLEHWLLSLTDVQLSTEQAHVQKAIELGQKLLSTAPVSILLHGDLHCDNILKSQKEKWVVIDPKGVLGDPCFEVAAFIRNPITELLREPAIASIINARVRAFSCMLDLEEQRIHDWVYIQTVLGVCWRIEDGEEPDEWLRFLRVIN